MKIVLSKYGVPTRLSEERLAHITQRHPEMQGQEMKILETIADPDLIQEGDAGTRIALKHYAASPLTEKFCAVVYAKYPKRTVSSSPPTSVPATRQEGGFYGSREAV